MAVTLNSARKHGLFCAAALLWLVLFALVSGSVQLWNTQASAVLDPFAAYGTLFTYFMIFIRLLSLLALPQVLFNLFGLLAYNAFPDAQSPRLKSSPLLAPFLCVRVVTRGLYPKLVKDTVAQNMKTLSDMGFENYIVQVVTDVAINIGANNKRVQEIVVPSTYSTKTGALNKSRALQYCLEDDVNLLSDDDWVLHLDEETLLTDASVRGILNFVTEDKHPFGQGLITYASSPVHFRSWSKFLQNRICTVADSFRVADDMGKLRCQFKLFHKPIFGWKGSYVVTKLGAERKITFDNGPAGSKAEDAFFAMLAMDQNYSFDFIEGEMHEKSPFTFADFFKQRKRWMQGIFMVVTAPSISLKTKALLALSLGSWLTLPLTTLNLILSQWFPFRMHPVTDFLLGFLGAMALLAYWYGYIKQHPVHRYSWFRLIVAIPEIVLSSLLSIVVENCAVCTMWFGDWYDFYIVDKEVEEETDDRKIVENV